MNIGIDMMGGDFAPLEAVKGVKHYLTNSDNNIFAQPMKKANLHAMKKH